MNTQLHNPASGQEIREILGPVDDELINRVLKVEADRSEVLQAFEWLNDDDYMGAQLEKPVDDRIRRVYEILRSEGPRDDEDR